MPERLSFEEAAALVVGGGTAWDGLVNRGRLQAGETVLITAAAGGVGSAAVQLTAAVGPARWAWPARVTAITCGAWARARCSITTPPTGPEQVLAVVPGGVDVLFDAAGGQTRDQAVGAVREGGRAVFLVGAPAQLGHGVVGESLDADVTPRVLEAIAGWSRRAGCAPRSRRYSRSSRCAKRCNGSPADTRAARSCSRLGSSCRRASRPISAN